MKRGEDLQLRKDATCTMVVNQSKLAELPLRKKPLQAEKGETGDPSLGLQPPLSRNPRSSEDDGRNRSILPNRWFQIILRLKLILDDIFTQCSSKIHWINIVYLV